MSFWKNIYFMDANSPIMEMMIFFHDHTMIIIFSIMNFLFINFIFLIMNKKIKLNLIENHLTELIWTISPFMMLIFIGLPSLHLLYIMEESFHPFTTLKITGHQWYWSYTFKDLNFNLDCFMNNSSTNNHFRLIETSSSIILPSNLTIRTLVTSQDVIHSWTLQSLGVKTDAIPGRLNLININAYRPGIYFGQCSEICGVNHSFMPIMIKISSPKYFLKWYLNSI